MIEIDGSHGEGGGQILRTSVGLSALTMTPVRVINIRAGRKTPGLRNQHIAGIELTGRLVDAETRGLSEGSMEIQFRPRERRAGRFVYDIGTAGAISLVLQAVVPAAAFAPGPVEFEIRGGTDVAWSPPIDYMKNVFAPMVGKLGVNLSIEMVRRGHYPRGGGLVRCHVEPVTKIVVQDLLEFSEIDHITGISHCVRLPHHVAERQAKSAESRLRQKGVTDITIETESYPKDNDPHLGPGSGIVIWAESTDGHRLGADSLGARGKPAEKVGNEAAGRLLDSLSTGMAIDPNLGDMLVPYMALSSEEMRIGLTEITGHLKTNLWVVERILGCSAKLEGRLGESGVLSIAGAGPLLSE
ncbi:RNA 3'-terminal phosphate cyclase [Candidatus Thorarchaeota archaeon]|nr:MAG: RNA 3'-terminal phosphate cyclase [Candidatus Thorarchaeota archaeon]